MIRILHIVEDFSVKSGGLRTVVQSLDFHLKSLGYKSYILSSGKEKEDKIFIVEASNKWLYSKQWKDKIYDILKAKKIDVFHIHGVWLYPQYIAAKIAVKEKLPFVLSTHGMLQPWMWKKGKLKKKIYFNFLIKKTFNNASLLHTITENETENLRKLFINQNFKEIPNLIFMDKSLEPITIVEKYILYIGRLNKTKGIDLLIKAFSSINQKDFKLKIAGEINSYKEELDKIILKFDLNDKIEFLDIVKGDFKTSLFKKAWVVVSPTYSDVIGMVNLESASFKTPVITTYKTGLKEEWNMNGGKLINPNVEELKEALFEVLSWNENERNENGTILYNFVLKNYSWNYQLSKWDELYQSILSNA